MATTLHPTPIPLTSSSTPPTPPYPTFPRLPQSSSAPGISRNASTSSSRSTATESSTTSSLVAVPMRPPPIETRTAATSTTASPNPNEEDGVLPVPISVDVGRGGWGGRGSMRNGPRSRSNTLNVGVGEDGVGMGRSQTVPPERSRNSMSPTTPRASRFEDVRGLRGDVQGELGSPGPIRVTISVDPSEEGSSPPSPISQANGNRGRGKLPSPTDHANKGVAEGKGKSRTLSVDRREGGAEGKTDVRERRQSQVSAHSAHSNGNGPPKFSIRDFTMGEELGQGSYSTVVSATKNNPPTSPTTPSTGPPRLYAIKIVNKAHLVQERKDKYAAIERDALIRLSNYAKPAKATTGHRRVGSGGNTAANGIITTKKRSNTSLSGVTIGSASVPGKRRDSQSTITNSKQTPGSTMSLSINLPSVMDNELVGGVPMSPTLKSSLAGRRPSRSAEPPEAVPEREESLQDGPSQPTRVNIPSSLTEEPSPVAEDVPAQRASIETIPMPSTPIDKSRPSTSASTPKKRRASLAPSERSVKSDKSAGGGGGKSGMAHPGIIRMHACLVDAINLYFVLDLAGNGEMLAFLRKFGSFDVESTRYYAAQILDSVEFMHQQGVIHRDLKPENILLDDNMRIKITDFGSAKLLNRDGESPDQEGRKRSFVGSADFVSPEVLRNEPAVPASDTWALGCVIYHLLVGKPPFRGATDYLTFQKILKKDMEWPEGFDEDAKALIDQILHLDPAQRPTPSELKTHPFLSSIDFSTLWSIPAPRIQTGLNPPIATLANLAPNSDLWAVFDEEVSDGGFEYDDVLSPPLISQPFPDPSLADGDSHVAEKAVRVVDSLVPPSQGFGDKKRGWSSSTRTSGRTGSSGSGSGSGGRTALTGFLESMGLGGGGGVSGRVGGLGGSGGSSGLSLSEGMRRGSRGGDRSEEIRGTGLGSENGRTSEGGYGNWSSLLLSNEQIILATPISLRPTTAVPLPSFLQPAAKRRQLILTDFPRLMAVKEENGELRVKAESVLVVRGSAGSAGGVGQGVRLVDVQEKGPRGFVLQMVGSSQLYIADSAEEKAEWVRTIKRVAL